MNRQYVQCGQLVIQTPAQKTDTDDQRRVNMAKGLVKIGRFLFTYSNLPVWGDLRKSVCRDGIHITDNGPKRHIGPAGQFSPPIGSHTNGCNIKCIRKLFDIRIPTTDKRDWVKAGDNVPFQGFFPCFWKTTTMMTLNDTGLGTDSIRFRLEHYGKQ